MIQQPTSHQHTNPPCMTNLLNDMIFTQTFEEFDTDSRQNRWGESLWTGASGQKPQVLLHTLKSKLHSSMGHTLINSSTRVLIYNTAKTLETRRCQVKSAYRTWTLASQTVSQNNATIHRSIVIQVPSQIPPTGARGVGVKTGRRPRVP